MTWSGKCIKGIGHLSANRSPLRDSIAILVQLLLSLNRRDLAQATYNSAKKFGSDSMLIQAMEAWIGLKTVCLYVLLALLVQAD